MIDDRFDDEDPNSPAMMMLSHVRNYFEGLPDNDAGVDPSSCETVRALRR